MTTPRHAADLAIVVLAYNRREALAETLAHLHPLGAAQVIVVDNASHDDTGAMVQRDFPWVQLIREETNLGVEGFNRGAMRAQTAYLLILDDDAHPEPAGLDAALDLMRSDSTIGGVMLHRLHPRTGEPEWPFDRITEPQSRWCDMGCGNLVRRDAWQRVGGYESRYFLYRNDTDLALSLRAAGYAVHFDPRWRVLHDSPIIDRRTPKWFARSTRNWVWLCRRHGRGVTRWQGIILGWLWAHRLARASLLRHLGALRGLIAGLVRSAPPLPKGIEPDGSALRELIRFKIRLRGG